MPTPVMTRPAPGFKAIPVTSSSRPGLCHSVTVRKDTYTATGCTCEAGQHSRKCRHLKRIQAMLDVLKAVKAEWPDCQVRQFADENCPRCGGVAFRVLILRERSEGGHSGYCQPSACPACGITRRYSL